MKGIEYPVSLRDLHKFDKSHGYPLQYFAMKIKKVYSLRNSICTKREHDIVLMLIEKGGIQHYCLVKSLSRLLSCQVSNNQEKLHFCERCLNHFRSEEALNKHEEYCSEYESVKIRMTERESRIIFDHYYKQEKVPFVVYAYFECYNVPIHTCQPNSENSYTNQY